MMEEFIMWKKCVVFFIVIALVVGSIRPVSYAAEAEPVVEELMDEENCSNDSSAAAEEIANEEKGAEDIAVSENSSIDNEEVIKGEQNENDETQGNPDDATGENQDESIQGDSNETDEEIGSGNSGEAKGETLPIISEEASDLSVSGNDTGCEENKEDGDSISSNTLTDISKNLNKLLDNYFDWLAHGTAGISESEILEVVSENVFNDMVRRYEGLSVQHKIIDEVSYEVLEQDLKGGNLQVNVSEIINGRIAETIHIVTVSSEDETQWRIENDIYEDTKLSGIASSDLEISFYSFSTGYPNTWENTGDHATDIANIALTQVGYHETANDHTKYNNWFYGADTSAAWCAIFISWCADQAGIPRSIVKKNARASGYNTSNMSSNPYGAPAYSFSSTGAKIGDIVFIDNTGNGTSNHVGLVYAVDSDYIYTIEGNYSEQVYKCKYLRSTGYQRYVNSTAASVHIVFYARPNYAVGTTAEGNIQMKVHAWFSDTIMGEQVNVFTTGNIYYLCYELIDVNTGKRIDQVHGGLSYAVTEKIKGPNGSIAEGVTYSNDNNYCGWNLSVAGEYTGIIIISGSINGKIEVSCTVQNRIELQMHRWLSDAKMGDSVSECRQGEIYYDCYELIDRESGTRINSLAAHDYTLLQEIYNPDGALCVSYTHTNKDNEWLGFTAKQCGTYTIRYTLKGTIGSNQYDYSVDKSVYVKENPITITVSKKNISLVMGQKESETIDVTYDGYYNGNLSFYWERSNSNVDCSWGDSSEKTCPLTLTANTVGNTVVTVSMIDANTKQKLASVDISVSVVEKNYTITYHANGGTGAPSSQIKAHGSALTLSSIIPSRFGYNFLGWNTSAGATSGCYKPGDRFTENANTILYAVWKAAPTITVDPESIIQDVGNIAISIAGTTEYIRIEPQCSSTYILYSEGNYDTVGSLYDLNGNQLASDDNGGGGFNFKIEYLLEQNTTYYLGVRLHNSSQTSGDILIMVDKKTDEIPYRVTFDSCGGTDIPAQLVPSGGKVAEPSIPVRSEYTFAGWYTDANCTMAYDFNTIVTKDFTLYAKWELIETSNCVVKFDTQGGSVVESQIVGKGAKANMPEEPVRVGYIFEGWYCDGELFDFDTEITADITLTAVWTKIGQIMAPVANIASGSILEAGTELCLRSEEGATIYYTINGEEPTTASILYTNPIIISESITIRTFAVKEGYNNSEIVTLIYIVEDENVEETTLSAPIANLASGIEVEIGTKIILTCLTNEAEIYYTVNGEDPTKDSTLYIEPIVIDKSVTIKAIAIKNGYKDSDIAEFFYKVKSENNENDDDWGDILVSDRPDTPKDIPERLWIAGIRDYVYTGQSIQPQVNVYYGKQRLVEYRDYTISFKNNVKAADSYNKQTPKIVVKGKGNYVGTVSETFAIKKADLTESNLIASAVYSVGRRYNPSVSLGGIMLKKKTDYTLTYLDENKWPLNKQPTTEGNYYMHVVGKGNCTGSFDFAYVVSGNDGRIDIGKGKAVVESIVYGSTAEPNTVLNVNGSSLVKDKDYTVTFPEIKKKGTATCIFVGKGDYTGVLKKTFKVKAATLAAATVIVEDSVPYEKGGAKPKVTVKVGRTELKSGVDYTISYKNNKKLGVAGFTVRGKGNYTGNYTGDFRVTVSQLDENKMDIFISDIVNGKKPFIVVYDRNGQKMIAPKDYVAKLDTINHRVNITGGKNGLYTGNITKAYKEFATDKIITSVSLNKRVIPKNFNEYTGSEITLKKEWLIVKSKKIILPSDAFTVSYVNNVDKGTATMIIKGVYDQTGGYVGTKLLNFKIKSNGLQEIKWLTSLYSKTDIVSFKSIEQIAVEDKWWQKCFG